MFDTVTNTRVTNQRALQLADSLKITLSSAKRLLRNDLNGLDMVIQDYAPVWRD